MTPGQADLAREELREAGDALRAARILLREGLLRDAASRLYYAVFHAARATLTVRGLVSKTHSGPIQLYTETLGPAPVLGRAFELRGDADYSVEGFSASAEDLETLVEDATRFIVGCRGSVLEVTGPGPDEPDPPPED